MHFTYHARYTVFQLGAGGGMFNILRKFSAARSEGGKPVPKQLLEALRLRMRPSPLGISEYLDCGIWHRTITPAMRDEFIGWRQSNELDKLFNDESSAVPSSGPFREPGRVG